MGLDRHEYVRQPCPCGKGQIEIDYCLPDHPWAKPESGNFQLSLRCERCNKEYKLIEQGSEAIFVRKAEVDARDSEGHEIYERGRKIEALEEVRGYVTEFEKLLLPKNDADKYRLFKAAGFYMQSITTFRKELKRESLSDLVRRKFHWQYLPELIRVLGKENKKLVDEVENMRQRQTELSKPFNPIGEPICTLTSEAFYEKAN